MISVDRRKFILDYLQEHESVTSNVLVEKLGVTAMTVGRDLKQMEEKGLLVRMHGGAMLPNYLVEETAYSEKKILNKEAKERIADKAVKFVHPGMTLFLDAGTTTFEVAARLKRLQETKLVIVTNDLHIGVLLYAKKDFQVILLGGTVLSETGATSGGMATDQLRDYNIDLAFIGTSAITDDLYIGSPTEAKCIFKRQILVQSEEAILVADRSKFCKKKLYKVTHLRELDHVITDFTVPEEESRSHPFFHKFITV